MLSVNVQGSLKALELLFSDMKDSSPAILNFIFLNWHININKHLIFQTISQRENWLTWLANAYNT